MNTPKIKKGTIETVKTVIIAILVTAVIAFVGGMHFSNQRNAEMQGAVKAAQASATTEAKK
jgi:Mn2+/Fe2+ NRAMP family transporter